MRELLPKACFPCHLRWIISLSCWRRLFDQYGEHLTHTPFPWEGFLLLLRSPLLRSFLPQATVLCSVLESARLCFFSFFKAFHMGTLCLRWWVSARWSAERPSLLFVTYHTARSSHVLKLPGKKNAKLTTIWHKYSKRFASVIITYF